MSSVSVSSVDIIRHFDNKTEKDHDLLVVEEPLEIRIGYGKENKRSEFSLAVTMRTPGADEELARGFLLSEGIISNNDDLFSVKHCLQAKQPDNTIRAELQYHIDFDTQKFQRNFFTNSSCGVCGKAVLESLRTEVPIHVSTSTNLDLDIIKKLSLQIEENQHVFKRTGGLHAAALFDLDGNLLVIREDIGRHNALDKLIGVCAIKSIDLSDKILWLSGRIGMELVQKSAMVGIKNIVALGAPSSLAIDIAKENMILLIGFLKSDQFNVYSFEDRLNLQ